MSGDQLRRKFGLSDIVSLVAVGVATAAALAAVYETRIVARHQSISVWPYLQMFAGIVTDEDASEDFVAPFSFNIANKGVGPAIIESIDVRYKGQSKPSLYHLLTEIASENELDRNTLALGEANLDEGEVVEAGEMRWVVTSGNREFAAILGRAFYVESNVEVEVCYCSLYKECWRLTFPASRPEKIDACRPE